MEKIALRRWKFRLYVAGNTSNSLRALSNLKRICEEYLAGNFEIEVIDVEEQPHLSREDRILAIPTLVRNFPQPARQLIGDLSNTEQTLAGLDLDPMHVQ